MSRRGRRHAHYPGSGEGEPWLISGVPRAWAVAPLAGIDLPYALAAAVRSSAGQIICPAHLLAAAALFMVILHQTGRIPVETHTGTNEFGMIGSDGCAGTARRVRYCLASRWAS